MMRKLLVILLLAGCGPSSAELRAARDASYQTDRDTLWRALVAEMHEQFPATGIAREDAEEGLIESKWKSVETTQSTGEEVNGDRFSKPERIVFRMMVKIQPGGPPWAITVDGQAARYRPELSALETFKPGSEDEPDWVKHRIAAMRVAIHHRLQQYAVAAPPQ